MEINRNVLLPNLLTLGNGVCGYFAVTELFKVDTPAEGPALAFTSPESLSRAAWLILLGMVFDVFDGKVARLSGGASALGAILDSLCDLITFGLAPALLILRLNQGFPPPWQRVVWLLALVYFVGAILRLARFTAESVPDEDDHLAFKGLPSPGAAGCVASLVVFYRYVSAFEQRELHWLTPGMQQALQGGVEWIPVALPFLGMVLGLTMVSSRLRFPHIGSFVFQRKQSFDLLAWVIFGAIVVALIPEVILPAVFLGYLLVIPVRGLFVWMRPRRKDSTVT